MKNEQHGLPEPVRGWTLFLLRKAAQRVGDFVDHELAFEGLTARHVGVLSVIAEQPGLNQAVLGSLMHIDRTTVVALVDHVEERGWIERRPGTEDRRMRELFVTHEGAKQLPVAKHWLLAAQDEALLPLSATDISALNRLLVKLLEPR